MGFLFGFLVMILAALVFFSGGVIDKFCQDFESPEYVIFAKVSAENSFSILVDFSYRL